jgi:hypothetical protein
MQVTLHGTPAAQVTVQLPWHLVSHVVPAAHITVPLPPMSNLQLAISKQDAEESAPAFSSHFDDPAQMMLLLSPPAPLHSDESWHASVTGPVVIALHFAAVMHVSMHPSASHVVLQSVPAAHVHCSATHMQPVPEQAAFAAGPPLPPHPIAKTRTSPTNDMTVFIGPSCHDVAGRHN